MIPAREALERLREGNRRFVSERGESGSAAASRVRELAAGQEPFAVVLGCSDSRVPAEIVFDQGLGDLFVIRVAGNIAAPSQIGSVEFAAEKFGTRLVVVVGHSRCGAILAALDSGPPAAAEISPNLLSIVDHVRPSVEAVRQAEPGIDPDLLVARAVRANVRSAAADLRKGSSLIARLVAGGDMLVVGAEYSLETGVVDFFDGVSARS